jgi:hypothetical protein
MTPISLPFNSTRPKLLSRRSEVLINRETVTEIAEISCSRS